MKRPLADKRPIGPFTEMLSFSQGPTDVEYTMLYASPAVPSHVDASDAIINSFTSQVERALRVELDLNDSQYDVFTESIVAEDLRRDGNMLVVKLMNVGMSDSEAMEAAQDLKDEIKTVGGVDELDGVVYRNDFFKDSNAEKIGDV